MSVEVLRGQGYDQACDWWSAGVICYEMLYGFPPFVSKSRNITRQKIMNWRTSLKFPSRPRISKEAQNFIEMLICEKEDRLGTQSDSAPSRPQSAIFAQQGEAGRGAARGNGARTLDRGRANEIKDHPWFRGTDFDTIHLQTPPFVPELATPGDTKYFDDDIDPNPLAAPDAAGAAKDATKDPMLKGAHGADNLDMRKQLAFQVRSLSFLSLLQFHPAESERLI